jgi:hypothetical protein
MTLATETGIGIFMGTRMVGKTFNQLPPLFNTYYYLPATPVQ